MAMKPLVQKKIEFDNTCGCIVDYELLEKAVLWFAPDNLHQKRSIYMHGRYPAVSVYNKKIHVHRLLMLYTNRQGLAENLIVHHKDGDVKNSKLENLELMTSKLHGSHHNKGKTLSEEHKRKIAEAGKRRKGMKIKKRVNLDGAQSLYDSGWTINKIAKHFGCNWATVKNRIHQNPELLEA